MRHRIHAVQALAAVALAAALPTAAVAAAGDLDAAFGNGGKVTTDFFGLNDRGSAIAVQPDGKIVVAGTTNTFAPASAFLVTRYNADGSLDQGFGTAGKATAVDGGNASALAVQADGKIVVAGSAHGDFALARFTTTGALDAGFGAGGQVRTDFFGRNDSAAAVAIDGNGRIVVAGIAFAPDLPDFALARYNSDGSLDATFGTAGRSRPITSVATTARRQSPSTEAGRSSRRASRSRAHSRASSSRSPATTRTEASTRRSAPAAE
jgi:uncharacterized delta-60 repeat protein